eukprot:g33385.t1
MEAQAPWTGQTASGWAVVVVVVEEERSEPSCMTKARHRRVGGCSSGPSRQATLSHEPPLSSDLSSQLLEGGVRSADSWGAPSLKDGLRNDEGDSDSHEELVSEDP